MRAFALLSVLVLTTTALPFVHADPGGDDAGDTFSDATPIGPGNHTGIVGPRGVDWQDWYRIDHAGGEGVRIAVIGGVLPQVYWAEGEPARVSATWSGANETRRLEFIASGDGAIYLQVYALGLPNATPYALEIALVPIADAAVESVRLTPYPGPCIYDCAMVPYVYRVHVELVNHGALPYSGDILVSVDSHWSPSDDFARQYVTLAPGARVVLAYDWLGVAVGEVTFRATADPDPGRWNNEGSVEQVVVADVPIVDTDGVVVPLRPL